jgi:hypothetical protein
MNDPIMDELNEAVPRLTEEALKSMDEFQKESQYRQQVLQEAAGGDQGQTEQTNQTQSQTGSKELQEVEPNQVEGQALSRKDNRLRIEEKIKRGERVTFADTFAHNRADLRNPLNAANYPAAMGAGMVDFAIDTVNIIPGVKLPKLPKYESATLQGIREMSGIIIPALYGGMWLKSLGTAAHAKVAWSVGNNPLMKFFGNAGADALAGGIVDRINTVNETDHNAAGSLKAAWPQTYGWIPENIATLDSDSPEVKRMKNVNEGIGLSFFGDILLGGTKVLRELKGIDDATQWVPKSEKAKAWVDKKNAKKTRVKDPVENEMVVNSEQRKKEFTELGKYNLEITEDIDLDKPIKGVHKLYDDYEVGFRTQDADIVSASVDAVRISKNIDSVQGRVGSVFTDSALRKGLNLDDGGFDTMRQLSKDLQLDVEWHGQTGKVITHKEVVEVGEDLAAALYEMDVPEMKRVIDTFLTGTDADTGIKVLSSEGYVGVFNAIKKYFDDYMNMDLARAQAYMSTSLAGQVSDLAEGARLMEDAPQAVQRAQEQILDRLQYLMNIKAQTSYARGRALNMTNIFNRIKTLDFRNKGGKKNILNNAFQYVKEQRKETIESLRKITIESKEAIDLIRMLNAEKPSMLKPLMLAYETTGGNVNTIAKLNKYFQESTGVFRKALIDLNPDMPSVVVQGAWANIYNSVLSAIGTPLKAAMSNLALMIERPISTMAGALIQGDIKTLRRASYMYTVGMVDTLQQATKHMNIVFRQASRDPSSVEYVMRKDFQIKNQKTLESLQAFADAKSAEGLEGPAAMMERVKAMNDLAEHPWLRFGANSMTAFDGFTRSFIASVEARGRAYDALFDKSTKITDKSLKEASDKIYKEMFDENGMITDKGVEYASREIAMNLDNPGVDGINSLLTYAPVFKPFLMFPRTAVNMLRFAGSHNPLGLFINKLNAFRKPFAKMDGSEVERLLRANEVDVDSVNIEAAYETIRAELKGRKAIGTLSVFGAVGLFSTDRLHGNGLYDKTRQRTRQQLGWQPRSYKGWDGKWYSYDGLGAISDWIALTADVMDNFDTLDSPSVELYLNKMGHILAANIVNKSFLAGLEPMNDVLAGNPAAMNRWLASFGSSFVPGSGLRNEFGRLLSPQLKEVEQEFTQLLANRNPIAKEGLPNAYDWVDGGLIKEPQNFWQRLVNTYSPAFKRGDDLSPIKQFLIDVEFDGRPQLNTNGNGVEYSPEQRSQVTQIMGRDKLFAKEVQRIMNTPEGKNFRKEYKKAINKGVELDRKQFKDIHRMLKRALRNAQNQAELQIAERGIVEKKQYYNRSIENATRRGDIEEIIRLQKEAKNLL